MIETDGKEIEKSKVDAYMHMKAYVLITSQEAASESEKSQESGTIFVINVGDPGSIDIDKGTAIIPILHYRPSYKKDNPFSHIDELLNNEEKVHLFINHIKSNLIAPYKERLAKRINDLFDFAIEDEADGIGISADSLQHFIAFLQRYPALKYPDVVLSPEENIVSEWHIDSNHHFSVDFLPSGDIRFVIFGPNPKNPEKTDRFSGASTWDCLYEFMKDHGVLNWAL